MTVMENRAVTIGAGIILTFGVYAAIKLIAGNSSLRRQAAGCRRCLFHRSRALSFSLLAADRFQDKPHDEFQYVSKEGYQVTEVGDADADRASQCAAADRDLS